MREPIVKLVLATLIMLFSFAILPATPAESATCCQTCQSRLSSCNASCDSAYTSCAMHCPGCPF
jgi:hypothetical protein